MAMPSMISNLLNTIAKNYSNDVGKLLIHTGIAGYFLSSLAQVAGIICNKKNNKEQKHYMVNQEIGECAINILTLFTIGKATKFLGSKLATTGKILPKSVSDLLKNNGFSDSIGKWGFDIERTGVLSNASTNLVADFNKCKKMLNTVGTIFGSVLSGSLVAPYCRNAYASFKQNSVHPTQNPKYYRVDLSKYNAVHKSSSLLNHVNKPKL